MKARGQEGGVLPTFRCLMVIITYMYLNVLPFQHNNAILVQQHGACMQLIKIDYKGYIYF